MTLRAQSLTRETVVPSVPDISTAETVLRALKALKQIAEVREGTRGDPLDASVTFRDLYEAGLISVEDASGVLHTAYPPASTSGAAAPSDHALLSNLNSSGYYHLTETQADGLTDGAVTSLHSHNHAGMSNLNSASYYHLTSTEYTDLTDAGDSALHYHATDRALANATGTLSVANGGTGRDTGVLPYALVATGSTATGAQQTIGGGLTTAILVGGGASALPIWTTATGSDAPVRATAPTITNSILAGTVTMSARTTDQVLYTSTDGLVTSGTSLGYNGTTLSQTATISSDSVLGMSLSYTPSGSTSYRVGMNVVMNAGYTGTDSTTVMQYQNASTSSPTSYVAAGTAGYYPNANHGIFGFSYGTNTGTNVGSFSSAMNGLTNYGAWSVATTAKANSTNIGVFASGRNTGSSGVAVGGYFTMRAAASAPAFTSAALIADNDDQAVPIFLARDNGTTVVTIANGGAVTMTQALQVDSTLTVGSTASIPGQVLYARRYAAVHG